MDHVEGRGTSALRRGLHLVGVDVRAARDERGFPGGERDVVGVPWREHEEAPRLSAHVGRVACAASV